MNPKRPPWQRPRPIFVLMTLTIVASSLAISSLLAAPSATQPAPSPAEAKNPFDPGPTDPAALPEVPPGFTVSFFAKEPLIRNPAAMAFDARGRLFVGMGPQYRNPRPNTPGDRIVVLTDSHGDGVIDTARTFATGFNCIQGLCWHGKDLWVANSPDLTIVRDNDGDDEADEYVRVYTDLGNLEHAIHGLNWAPDGKLYLSKGNSKGYSLPDSPTGLAPKPFRDLWGVTAPPGSPDMPPIQVFKKGEYQHTYHDPRDDWGREGGVLRCDDLGRNLEIVSRGLRNPWDVAYDAGFNWLGSDNDQEGGDRIIMPFYGAHFGWSHTWSPHWTGKDHLPTVPVSGRLFDGSGTGIVYSESTQFPERYRNGFFIGDWLFKKIYFYRPRWDGAMIQPDGGEYEDFIRAGRSLFRPTAVKIGPDGALYVLGWGKQYGVQWGPSGEQVNEGRVIRIAWGGGPAPPRSAWYAPKHDKPYAQWTFDELAADLTHDVLPVWRTGAQEELVRRGAAVRADLLRLALPPNLSESRQTWALWTLGRIAPEDREIDRFFSSAIPASAGRSINFRVQANRILAYRLRESQKLERLSDEVLAAMQDPQPRIRFEAVQAAWQAKQVQWIEPLKNLAAKEADRATFYSAWCALRDLAGAEALELMLADSRGGVRRAALLGLLDLHAVDRDRITLLLKDPDPATAGLAALWLAKSGGNPMMNYEPPPGEFSDTVTVKLVAGFKPSVVRYTLDGSTPTAQSSQYVRPITLDATTTLKTAIFVDGKPVGPAGEVKYIKAIADEDRPGGLVTELHFRSGDKPTIIAEARPLLPSANALRGKALFFGAGGAGCVNCHRVGGRGRSFGPELTGIGDRNDPDGFVQSILEPNAIIVEGYATQLIVTRDKSDFTGILKEETDVAVTLNQGDGRAVRIEKKEIVKRRSLGTSAMPDYSEALTPQEVADLTAFLLSLRTAPVSPAAARP